MSQLSHWNPFKSLAKMESPASFDELFRGFGMRPTWRELEALPDIRIDVSETDQAYLVRADLPGVAKEDIEVTVEGREVAISAQTRNRIEHKGETSLHVERSEGRVYRSFTLPQEVDNRAAQAQYDNGVLSLSLPKAADRSQSRIAVS